MDKNEALKKCLRVLEPIKYVRIYESQWVDSAIEACKEALKQSTQEWQGLSDDEITNSESDYTDRRNGFLDVYGFAKDIELILKEKNHG